MAGWPAWLAAAGLVVIAGTGPVRERLRVREIDDDEGQRLMRIIRRSAGSVVTWRRAQMVLLSAQGMDTPAIARVAFTSEDPGVASRGSRFNPLSSTEFLQVR